MQAVSTVLSPWMHGLYSMILLVNIVWVFMRSQITLYEMGIAARAYDVLYENPDPIIENIGFRVASVIPEPATLSLLALGGLSLLRKRK